MDEWIFVAIFHNLSITTTIGNDFITIIPPDDPLTTNLRKRSKTFVDLVDNFTDQFNRDVRPSLLFVKKTVPPNIEAIIAFRNILAISSITKAWERFFLNIRHRISIEKFSYSNYFDLYPYTLSKDEKYLIVHTPSLLGLDFAKDFRGQVSPEIAIVYTASNFYDEKLFEALNSRWINHYVKKRTRSEWSDIALFRSLEMAYRATSLPFRNHGTIHDYGANLSLWVSAFEVLTHPQTEKVNYKKVLDFLGKIPFYSKRLTNKSYWRLIGKNKNENKRECLNLIQKTYFEIHCARNSFLHGNPVSANDLFPNRNKKFPSLTSSVPLIYKHALYYFLGLKKQIEFNDNESMSDLLERIDDITAYMDLRNTEEALINIRKPINPND